ncbi:DUF1569 domain-containing protein [Pedobacter psychrodurus]|uniref:DUF1569 domain-containing protein n=1 Tax=Pedobacter psychrodurus TaxID=2530456 RepID=UPI00292EC18E|nr:DUF1569 domain-containing protein [Pedobacter psychrodurus]
MKTIFDENLRTQLIERINTLNVNSTALWGKMNIYQMLKHCSTYEEMMLGKNQYQRVFLGKLFGKMALKEFTQDESPIKQKTPTLSQLKIKEKSGDVEKERKKWIALLNEYANPSDAEIVHPFFGKLSQEQVGQLVYKHTDHHLRQFNS